MVSCKNLSYCFSAVSKDREHDHPVTLLPSAAALLSGTFHDPGSLQLLSSNQTRCSSTCDILEFQPGSSFAPSSGKWKRESAKDDSLFLGTSDEEFVSPHVRLEALRQLGSCISAGPSAAVWAAVTAAASDVYLPLGGFLTQVEPYIVFVVLTGSAAAALKYCTALVCLFLVSFTGFFSVFLAGRFHGTLVDNRFLELALSSIGRVLGLRIEGPRMVLRWHRVTALFCPPSPPPYALLLRRLRNRVGSKQERLSRSWWCFWQVLGVSFCFC